MDIARGTCFCLNSKTREWVPHSFSPPVCNSSGLLVLGYYSWLRGKIYMSPLLLLLAADLTLPVILQHWSGRGAKCKRRWEFGRTKKCFRSGAIYHEGRWRCGGGMNRLTASSLHPVHSLSWGEKHRARRVLRVGLNDPILLSPMKDEKENTDSHFSCKQGHDDHPA